MANISNDPLKFSDILKSLRLQRSWSQKKLAEKLDLSEDTIKHWEGGNGLPNLYNRQKLSEFFGMSIEELGLAVVEEDISSTITTNSQGGYTVSEQSQLLELNHPEAREENEENIPSIEEKKPEREKPLRRSPTLSEQSDKQVDTSRLQEQNRIRMLGKLRLTYKTLLEKSLQGAIWIDLALAEKGNAVSNATSLLLQIANQDERLLPSGTSILQAYDEAVQELLILGEPGAGKSTLLTDLAQHLIKRAEDDVSQPLPVIVPLSSWAEQRLPIAEWLGEQMSRIYSISRQMSDYLVNERQVLPLLDSLDEMDQEALPSCITAINSYHQEYQGALVVCSRTHNYEIAQRTQSLTLQNAVVVQPLSQAQVTTTLEQMGKPLIALHQIMKGNSALQELATKPLMLNLLLFAYQGLPIKQLPTQASELQQSVLRDYVNRMIFQKGDNKRYPLDRTCSWLGWLAQKMRYHNLDIFYLEYLQQTWLPTGQFLQMYKRLAGKGISILIGLLISLSFNADFFGGESFANNVLFALTGGLIGSLIYSERRENFSITAVKHNLKSQWQTLTRTSVKNGLLMGILIGLVFTLWPPKDSHGGLIAGGSIFVCCSLLTFIIQADKIPEAASSSKSSSWTFLNFFPDPGRGHIELGLFTGVLISLCIGLNEGVSMGISSGLSYTVIGIFLSLILLGKDSFIELKETVTFSVRNLLRRQHLLSTFSIFLLIFLLYGLSISLQHGLRYGLIDGFSGALSICILYWIFIGVWTGISQKTLENQDRIEFNQGIRYSFRNALLIGLLASGISILVGSFSDILNYELRSVFINGFPVGLSKGFSDGLEAIKRDIIFFELFGALLPFLLTGGLAWLRHYLLRFLLYCAKVAPLRYKHFLDDATRRIFLYQVGGGYRFIHRTLLDYFSEQQTE